MGLVVVVDRIKLGMALTNLLNNAIKFTPSGGGSALPLRASRQRSGSWSKIPASGCSRISLTRVFEAFHQVEDHMTRRHGGMGLGLAIAKGLVEAHGGHMWAESDGLGRGSTFYISLPLPKG